MISWTEILDMYVEIGDLREARLIFDKMPERNDVSWSSMISRFNRVGYSEEAMSLFREMVQCGVKLNTSYYSSIISALTSMNALQAGKNIHGNLLKNGMERDIFVSGSLANFLLEMWKCYRRTFVFASILKKNVVCWNSMVAYSLNGQLAEAKELFNQILNKKVFRNSLITYVETEIFLRHLNVQRDDFVRRTA